MDAARHAGKLPERLPKRRFELLGASLAGDEFGVNGFGLAAARAETAAAAAAVENLDQVFPATNRFQLKPPAYLAALRLASR
jgi:hypothetical protein